MRRTTTVLIALLLLATAPALASREQHGDWELGVFAGFGWPDDYDVPFEPDDDLLYGFRFGHFFDDTHSVEGSWQRFSADAPDVLFMDTTIGTTRTLGTLEGLEWDIDSFRVNYLRNYRAGEAVRPFWTIGFGSERTGVEGTSVTEVIDVTDPNNPMTTGVSRTSVNEAGSDLSVNVGGGLRWLITETFGLRWDARYVLTDTGLPFDVTAQSVESAIGVTWSFGGGPPPDADHDGVSDRRDTCPDTPGGARVDLQGCPIDSDGDGVFDGIDECPGTTAGWPVDPDGCPSDSDGDGVPDGKDTCADTPEDATVDENGCPSDSDGDGVLDGLDRCADTPKGATIDALGCPRDKDHDGVLDGIDQCPDTDLRLKVDEKGCPVITAPEIFQPGQTRLVLEGVTFALNSAEITDASAEALSKVADSLIAFPDARIQIGGYTDSTGSRARNLELSQRRADSVRAYLVARGVAEDRLVAVGYGQSDPIADNETEEGRAKNRRVELRLLDDGGRRDPATPPQPPQPPQGASQDG